MQTVLPPGGMATLVTSLCRPLAALAMQTVLPPGGMATLVTSLCRPLAALAMQTVLPPGGMATLVTSLCRPLAALAMQTVLPPGGMASLPKEPHFHTFCLYSLYLQSEEQLPSLTSDIMNLNTNLQYKVINRNGKPPLKYYQIHSKFDINWPAAFNSLYKVCHLSQMFDNVADSSNGGSHGVTVLTVSK